MVQPSILKSHKHSNMIEYHFISTGSEIIAGMTPNCVVPGRVAQSVTCLATGASLTPDPGIASLIPAWSYTFVEIDHEVISTVILLPSAESF